MKVSILFYRITIISIFIFSLLQNSCSKKSEDIDPELLFSETENAISSNYIFLKKNEESFFPEIYSTVLKQMNSDGMTRSALVSFINRSRDDDKRQNIYRALKLFLSALPGGVNSYVPPESLFWSQDPERDAGIGLVIRQEGPGKFMAIDTLEGSASNRENMEMGKYIVAVDDLNVSGMDLDELVGRIKGPIDSSVKLTFKDRSYKLVRGRVSFQNILNSKWNLDKGKTAEYIVIRSTLPGTADQLAGLIESLDRKNALVLDLRKLQPGDFKESFRVADLFLSSGRMGSLKMTNEADMVFDATPEIIFKKNIYLLVGGYQTPYADVIALALKSSDKVKVIGEDLFGKESFITRTVKTTSGLQLRITSGYVLNRDNIPFYQTGIKVDYAVDDILPPHPPLSEADREDPAQMKAAELIMASE